MTLVLPALKLRMGLITCYIAKVQLRTLNRLIRSPDSITDQDGYALGLDLQRDSKGQQYYDIANYIKSTEYRFFDPLILAVIEETRFEEYAKDIGMLRVAEKCCVVIDGQQQYKALEELSIKLNPKEDDILNDDIGLILIPRLEDKAMREIALRGQLAAKSGTKSDQILLSTTEASAIISRKLVEPTGPLGKQTGFVNIKNSTISARSKVFTTLNTVHTITESILEGIRTREKQWPKASTDERVNIAYERVAQYWRDVLSEIEPYQLALGDPKLLPTLRDSSSRWAMLFKPAVQIGLFQGLLSAEHTYRIPFIQGVRSVNKLDWRVDSELWGDIVLHNSDLYKITGQQQATSKVKQVVQSHVLQNRSN